LRISRGWVDSFTEDPSARSKKTWAFGMTQKQNQVEMMLAIANRSLTIRYAFLLGIRLPVRFLRGMEHDVRRRVGWTPPKLCGRLPGLLQAECALC
jgi:hypothetical protein